MEGLTPEEKRRIYEEEKARHEAQEKIKAEAKVAEANKTLTGCGIAFLIFIVMVLAMVACISSLPESPKHDKAMAHVMSEDFVKARLKSPGTAKFQMYDPANVRDLGDGVYEVRGYVDAQNGFGATIRNRYYCKLRYAGNDKWIAEKVELLGP